jgi:hypothetical protein
VTDPAADELELIPRSMRDKLDRARIKLHLAEWQQLSLAERRQLCDQPCDAPAEVERYRAAVIDVVRRRTGRTPDDLG